MIAGNFFPSRSDSKTLQGYTDFSQSPTLRALREKAAETFASLPNPLAKDFQMLDIAWETTLLQDFYVGTVRMPQGVVLCDLRDFVRQYPDIATRMQSWSSRELIKTRKLVACIEAFYNRAAVLYIPPNVVVADPLRLQEIIGAYRQQLLIEKIIIIVGAGASVVIHDAQANPAPATRISSREYYLEPSSWLEFVQAQYAPHDAMQTTIMAQEKSQCLARLIWSDAVHNNQWIDCYLQGPDAQIDVKGAYVLGGKERSTIMTRQVHQAAHTQSNLLLKGVLLEHSYALYQGIINIEHAASNAHAAQNNKTLLLSSHARARSLPTLEVLTNDVRCAHGSAVARICPDQIYYLQTRGLTHQEAHRALVAAFLAEVVDAGMLAQIMNKVAV